MKTSILIAVIFLCSSFVSASASPVKSPVLVSESKSLLPAFSFLRGHKQGRNYTITWGMTSNTGISHFIVKCTYEDPYDIYSVWQQIGIVPATNSPFLNL